MKGKFITFEGCEGVGKSHQIRYVEEYLKKTSVEYYLTREPGGSEVAEQIRKIILDGKNVSMTNECEALLYAAARVQHLDEIVKPKLQAGILVLCDRYVDSSLAYQGYGRGLGEHFVKQINSYALEKFMPDLTLFLDLEPEKAFLRKGGADKKDRLESSGMAFHKRVYYGYLSLADEYPERIVKIDASGSKEQTHEKIIQALKRGGII